MSWNSESPLVFIRVILTNTLGIRRAREIWAQISRGVDLWERFLQVGLVGDAEAEGAAREGRSACGVKEEYNTITRN